MAVASCSCRRQHFSQVLGSCRADVCTASVLAPALSSTAWDAARVVAAQQLSSRRQ
jgi:hypothetical protein